jgi:flagellar protein FlbD
MIELTLLSGKKFWLNPHQIEMMEMKPDTTIVTLTGKHIVVLERAEEVVDRIVAYRSRLGSFGNEA